MKVLFSTEGTLKIVPETDFENGFLENKCKEDVARSNGYNALGAVYRDDDLSEGCMDKIVIYVYPNPNKCGAKKGGTR
jgi:hypothetical protein